MKCYLLLLLKYNFSTISQEFFFFFFSSDRDPIQTNLSKQRRVSLNCIELILVVVNLYEVAAKTKLVKTEPFCSQGDTGLVSFLLRASMSKINT